MPSIRYWASSCGLFPCRAGWSYRLYHHRIPSCGQVTYGQQKHYLQHVSTLYTHKTVIVLCTEQAHCHFKYIHMTYEENYSGPVPSDGLSRVLISVTISITMRTSARNFCICFNVSTWQPVDIQMSWYREMRILHVHVYVAWSKFTTLQYVCTWMWYLHRLHGPSGNVPFGLSFCFVWHVLRISTLLCTVHSINYNYMWHFCPAVRTDGCTYVSFLVNNTFIDTAGWRRRSVCRRRCYSSCGWRRRWRCRKGLHLLCNTVIPRDIVVSLLLYSQAKRPGQRELTVEFVSFPYTLLLFSLPLPSCSGPSVHSWKKVELLHFVSCWEVTMVRITA